jgi:NAD-dependent SIR2 family protein deacetylase
MRMTMDDDQGPRSLGMPTDDRHPQSAACAAAIRQAARVLADAEALLITAGAGMGVDSGLPDFRSAGGFWRSYPRIGELGLSFEQMAQPHWFERDARFAWAFYGHRRTLYRRTEPHAGFGLLHRWMLAKPSGGFVFTSNVDGHFQKARFAEAQVVECHGSIHHLQCLVPCCDAIWRNPGRDLEIDEQTFRARGELPACPRCGSLARPNVLMFADGEWLSARTDAAWQRHTAWLDSVRGARLAVIELGAGVHLPAVRHYSEQIAGRFRATLVRINPVAADGPPGTVSIPLRALPALQAIAARMDASG